VRQITSVTISHFKPPGREDSLAEVRPLQTCFKPPDAIGTPTSMPPCSRLAACHFKPLGRGRDLSVLTAGCRRPSLRFQGVHPKWVEQGKRGEPPSDQTRYFKPKGSNAVQVQDPGPARSVATVLRSWLILNHSLFQAGPHGPTRRYSG
jgi:hypothetical protein